LNCPLLNDAWTAVLSECVEQTRAQFEAGRAVCDGVAGRLRYELRLTWLGGMRILEQVERTGAALRSLRPTIGTRDLPLLIWRAARWPSRSQEQ
jgi:phytoene synthase